MPNINTLHLSGAALNKSILDNLTGNTDSKAYIAETLNTTLRSKLTTALTARGYTVLADLISQIGPVDLVANKDVPLRTFVANQVQSKMPSDATLKKAVDDAISQLSSTTTVGDLLGLNKSLADQPEFQGEVQKVQLSAVLGTSPMLVDPDLQGKLIDLYAAHEGTAEQFWSMLSQQPDFKAPGLVENLQFTGQLDALTLGNVAVMKALQGMNQQNVRDLTKLDSNVWKQIVSASADDIPAQVPGAKQDERVTNYVDIINRTLHEAVPTTYIAQSIAQPAQADPALVQRVLVLNPGLNLAAPLPATLNLTGLSADEQQKAKDALTALRQEIKAYPAFEYKAALAAGGTTLQNPVRQAVAQFFVNAPDFDFGDTHIATYLSDHKDTALKGVDEKYKAAVQAQLERTQRVFRVTSQVDAINTLLGEGLDSAHSIASMPETVFMQQFQAKLGSEMQARMVYSQAQYLNSMTLHTFTQIRQAANDVLPRVIGSSNDVAEAVKQIPNWETLFGPLELCDCDHCHSVYSPAAYFVDLLQFLAKSAATDNLTPLDVLFERRPDLQYLKLTCENTNTPIPYIDLVNEILETYVALDGSTAINLDDEAAAGQAIAQNTSPGVTTEELQANPEYTREEAYEKKLKPAIYPLTLPFHRPLAIVRTYLEHLGSSRYEVMKTFQKSSAPSDQAIAYEYLKLSPEEYNIITGATLTPAYSLWEFYGYPAAVIAGVVPTESWEVHIASVPECLDRLGITYLDLVELVKTHFLNPAQSITLDFEPPQGAVMPDPCDLRNMKLKNLGTTDTFLGRLHRFVRLWKKLGWSIRDLDRTMSALGAGNIDAALIQKLALVKQLQDELNVPLAQLLSLWSTIDTAGDDALYGKLFLNRAVLKPTDPTYSAFVLKADGTELQNTGAKLSDYLPVILGALRITAADWALLSAAKVLSNDTLNLKNLSILYRYTVLARALRLSIKNLLTLINLTGKDPFGEHDPASTRAFVDIAQKVRQSGFSLAQLDYLYRHHAEPNGGVAPLQEDTDFLIKNLRAGLQRIASDNVVQPDPSGDLLRRKLSIILESKLVDQAMSIIDGSSTQSAADQGTFIQQHFAVFLTHSSGPGSVADAQSKLIGSASMSKEDRFAYVLTPLVAYLVVFLSQSYIKQSLGEVLKLDALTIDALLTRIVKARIDANSFVLTDFLALMNDSLAPFTQTVQAYLLLKKTAMLINGFSLTSQEITYLAANGSQFAGFDFNALPLATPAQTDTLLAQWGLLYDYSTLRNSLPKGEVGLIDVFAATSLSDLKTKLYEATNWDPAQLDALSAPQGFNLTTVNAFKPIALLRLQACIQLSQRLGVSVDHLFAWATNVPEAKQAQEVKDTVKARYDDASWLAVAKSLNDGLREQQRDALVGFLLQTARMRQHLVHTESQLYEHFLIDVDMSACMLTSRIVQANAAIQLFLQRCLMNLEQQVSPTAIDARQWSWVKRYRVWEANRKVFLYPENWIEPGLRDDKSPFFKELEAQLLQKDIAADSAEQAFLNYLNKLDEVARLEICGLYWEEEAQGVLDWRDLSDLRKTEEGNILHVFGRTFATPHIYYYRQYRLHDNAGWTPWEKVAADIEGDHLIPVVYNRRIHLFWPIFAEKSDPNTQDTSQSNPAPKPVKYLEVKLAWSEYKQGKWIAKQVSRVGIVSLTLEREKHFFRALLDSNGDLVIQDVQKDSILPHLTTANDVAYTEEILRIATFRFTGCHGTIDAQPTGFDENNPLPFIQDKPDVLANDDIDVGVVTLPNSPFPYNNRSSFMTLVGARGQGLTLMTGDYDQHEHLDNKTLAGLEVQIPTLGSTPSAYSILPADEFWQFALQAPFFYQDAQRTYFVTPYYSIPIRIFQRPDLVSFPFKRSVAVSSAVGGANRIDSSIFVSRAATAIGENASTIALTGQPATNGAATINTTTLHVGTVVTSATTPQASTTASSVVSTDGAAEVTTSAVITTDAINFTAFWSSLFWRRRFPTHVQFTTYFHPYVCDFIKNLNRQGIPGLLTLANQEQSDSRLFQPPGGVEIFQLPEFVQQYQPTSSVGTPYPAEDVDFTYGGPYALYNWELFFHIPLTIAIRLSKNQRFEDAQKWFHYIINPTTDGASPSPQRYWNVLPFLTTAQERIQDTLTLLDYTGSDQDTLQRKAQVEQQVDAWRRNPLSPHAIARMRPIAYQKYVVMSYIDNLISWADQLFRQETLESINEATMLYVLASEILGPRSQEIPNRTPKGDMSYYDLTHTQDATSNQTHSLIDSFSNAMVSLETQFPFSSSTTPNGDGPGPTATLGSVSSLLFCIPQNDKLLGYWDTVEDRLFKIRHCMNIEGVVRQLPLFAPPIDPALLVQASALGVDISSVLNDINAATPHYRFTYILQKALEICSDLKALGSSLLAALEKSDAEALAALRATQETSLLRAVQRVKEQQIEEAKATRESLDFTFAVTNARYTFYSTIAFMNDSEAASLMLLSESALLQAEENLVELTSSAESASPTIIAGVAGGFGSPVSLVSEGGSNIGQASQSAARAIGILAALANTASMMSSTMGGYQRRADEWKLQADMAASELKQIARQQVAADIRSTIAQYELENHMQQIDDAATVEDFLSNKYTNKDLYDWMISQVSALYFQSYQLAYDLARRAEKAYQFERGLTSSDYITFGYWDSLKRGLLAGERLYLDLKRLEAAYMDQNKREFEITKHISLVLHDPMALIALKETGTCLVTLPEALFDMDYPGHYMRRIKSVTLTIPCVTGPYTSVNCTLTLLSNKIRIDSNASPPYAEHEDDQRFITTFGAIESIATSTAQNDSGMFEVNFRDERYLPFEGAGAISTWRIDMPRDCNAFDFETISDVIIRLNHTARDGGARLRDVAKQAATLPAAGSQRGNVGTATFPEQENLTRLFSTKHEFSSDWYRFLQPTEAATTQVLGLALTKERFPFQYRGKKIELTAMMLFLKLKDGATYNDGQPLTFNLKREGATVALGKAFKAAGSPVENLPFVNVALSGQSDLGQWSLEAKKGDASADVIDDMWIVCQYAVK
jgi:Tc toxin complex TcA C-terminal TcB-binding domain/Neuraminidase-like domain/Salmonella virulence plasmid 28.1kDa A protein